MTEITLGRSIKRTDTTHMRDRIEDLTQKSRTDWLGKTSLPKASTSIPRDQPRASSLINDNYCVTKLQARLLAGSTLPTETIDSCLHLNVKPHVVPHVHTVPGHS